MQVTVVGTCPFPPLPPPAVSQTSGYEVVKRVRPSVMMVLYCPLHFHSHLRSQALLNLHIYFQTDVNLWVCS